MFFNINSHWIAETNMKNDDLSIGIRKLITPLYSWFALIYLLLIPFMLWDLFVLGLPSEGGLARKPFAPSSFELIVTVVIWIATSVKPVWDSHIKEFLDNVGRALLIYSAYKWIRSKWARKKEKK
jgi:hypothetical protein